MQVGDRSGGRVASELSVSVTGTAAGWSLLLPDNWYHIALDASRHRRVDAMLEQLFASLPRDAVFRWRRELGQQISSLTDDALAEGGSDVYLLIDPRYGLPLAATCLATLIPTALPADVPAEVVARTLAERADDRPGVLLVEGQECAAVRRDEFATVDDDTPPADASTGSTPVPATLTVICLDVYIPLPGSAHTLLLSFRTPVAAVADPMVTLFEAIAQSLRWKLE